MRSKRRRAMWGTLWGALLVGPVLELAWWVMIRTPKLVTTPERPSMAFGASEYWSGRGCGR
jgi:hypothetical protein